MIISFDIHTPPLGVIEKRFYVDSVFPKDIDFSSTEEELNKNLVLLDDILDSLFPLLKVLDDRKLELGEIL
jgi:hypothetical protein